MPSTVTASEEIFLFEISGTTFGVLEFTAYERLSSPYEVTLTLASEDEIEFEDVVGEEALLTLLSDEQDRYVHGIISQFMKGGSIGRFYIYQARMVPSLWLLSLENDCRIFQNKTVQDIITTVLQDAGITNDRFDFRLQSKRETREYCVQYRETDLNFISRLLEEEGIFYFFEHKKDSHILVFGDSTVNYKPIEGEAEIMFHIEDDMVPGEEAVNSFVLSQRIHTGKTTYRDFNFTKPSLDLTAQEEGDGKTYQKLEVYDYPGEYLDEQRGKTIAKIRLEEAIRFKERADGEGSCPRFIPGFTFELSEHDRDDLNKEYLLSEVVHNGVQPQVTEEQSDVEETASYTNSFQAIPSDVTFRPGRKTPKPIVEGVQTAIVTGPAGEEIWTDKYGRVKVKFHWDRIGKRDEKSSCWIRASQNWAGANWGGMFIPRIDQEVIVDFIEGDPDRPIITGRVYNEENLPPYTLPDDKTKSTIRSNTSLGGGSANELLMEDLAGKTKVVLSNAYGHKITQDEEKQTLTIETRDKNKFHMDDKNQNLSVETTKAHKLLFDDKNKKIVMNSTDGHTVELDDEKKKMVTKSKDGHVVVFDDENQKIEMTSKDGHTFIMDDANQKMGVTSAKGHAITIDDSGDSITLEDSGGTHKFQIDIAGSTLVISTDSGAIDIKAPAGTITLEAMDITMEATNAMKLKGGMSLDSEAGMNHTTKGTMVNSEASGVNTIKGSLVKIN